MVIYDSAKIYIQSCKTAKEKIVALEAIIDALLLSALDAASSAGIDEYSLDDGQTKIKTKYRSVTAIKEAIDGFTTLKNMYISQINGRHIRLVSSDSFIRNRYNGQ